MMIMKLFLRASASNILLHVFLHDIIILSSLSFVKCIIDMIINISPRLFVVAKFIVDDKSDKMCVLGHENSLRE